MARRSAITHGGVLTLATDMQGGLARRIGARVATLPHGLVRSLGNDGAHRQVSYRAAWERSARIAAALPDRRDPGCPPIVVVTRNVVDFVPAFWACLRGGHVVTALPSAFLAAHRSKDATALKQVLGKLGKPLLLVDAHFASLPVVADLAQDHPILTIADARAPAYWDDAAERPEPLCLVATSGSTGTLKLAVIDERAFLHRQFAACDPGQRPGTNGLALYPLDSVTGIRTAYLVHETITHVPQAIAVTRPDAILTAIDTLRISHMNLPNATANRLLEAAPSIGRDLDFSALAFCGMGGETVGRALVSRVKAMFARFGASTVIKAGYGATETGPMLMGAEFPAGAIDGEQTFPLGPCAPGVSMRIVGEEGAVLDEGEIGAVEVSAPLKQFSGYWGEPELSANAFTPDGWWKTGDLGQLDDGVFTFRGRSKDILVVQGRKLSLTEIDAQLQAHLKIGDLAFSCVLRLAGVDHERLAIAFVEGENTPRDRIVNAIRDAILRRFGIRPDPVVGLARNRLPYTATGKIRRDVLAKLILSEWRKDPLSAAFPEQEEAEISEEDIEAFVEETWRQVLNLDADFDRDRSFFDLGGDSLRSAALYACIEAKLDRRLAMDEFFAEPNYANLLRLTLTARHDGPESASGLAWPLPRRLRQHQLAYLETWSGGRPTRDRLVVSLNSTGSRPPIFWVFQQDEEFTALARELGPDQPLYGFRSGLKVIDYDEDEIQALALRYVHEIAEVYPVGSLFIAGTCQGALIALAVAQHILRRGRHVPLLILMEWIFSYQIYGGPVLLVYGSDSIAANPHAQYRDPDQILQRAFPEYACVEVAGGHSELFREANIGELGRSLTDHLAKAITRPPRLPTQRACRARIEAPLLPEAIPGGTTVRVAVTVRNTGSFRWDARPLGLALRGGWVDPCGGDVQWADERETMPSLAPGETARLNLAVAAPNLPGQYQFVVDLDDEARTWRRSVGNDAFRAPVTVTSESAIPLGDVG